MKKVVTALMLCGAGLYADYTMVYEMHDPEDPKSVVTSTFRYKDAQHGRIDMKMSGTKDSNTILISGKKAYMISRENGETNVVDMDEMMKMALMFGGGMPMDAEEEQAAAEDDGRYQFKRTGKKERVAGIKGEVWQITYEEDGRKKTEEAVMTDDSDYIDAMHAYEAVIKRMESGAGDMFPTEDLYLVHDGYVPLRIGNEMTLKSFSDDNVDPALFTLPKGAQVAKSPFGSMFASGGNNGASKQQGGMVDACYTQVCCGSTQGDAEVISKMASASAVGYKLDGTATCDALGLGALLGVDSVEGALYSKGKSTVTVTLEMDAKDKGNVLKTKSQRGGPVTVETYKTGFIGDYKYHYGVLQPMNVQELDVIIDSHTIVSFSHLANEGKVPLVKFAKESIDFDAYTPKKGKKSAKKTTPEHSDADKADDDSEVVDTEAINKGVGEAVDMLKSLF
jgi:hypothetical protein